MGLDFSKFEWTPNTMGKNWMSVCNFYGNIMPFLGQTLWQVGPMPFITQGWFPNANYGNWGDQFVSSYTPGAGGGGNDSSTLTENDRAKLIGNKTYGKGLIQKIVPLPFNTAMNVTIAKYLTPKGNDINKNGIKPDYEIEFSEKDIKSGKDVQLEKAIEVLKNI